MKEINVVEKVKTSVNLQRDILDKCTLISMGKDIEIAKLTETIKDHEEGPEERKISIVGSSIGSSNRTEVIEDLILMALSGNTVLYKINGVEYTPQKLLDLAKASIAFLIHNRANIDITDLIEVANLDQIEKLNNTNEALEEYIEKKGVENIIKNNVDEYLAGEGVHEIEQIIESFKNTSKSKSEMEAFENLGGYELIRDLLDGIADDEIKLLAENIDSAVDFIIDKHHYYIK